MPWMTSILLPPATYNWGSLQISCELKILKMLKKSTRIYRISSIWITRHILEYCQFRLQQCRPNNFNILYILWYIVLWLNITNMRPLPLDVRPSRRWITEIQGTGSGWEVGIFPFPSTCYTLGLDFFKSIILIRFFRDECWGCGLSPACVSYRRPIIGLGLDGSWRDATDICFARRHSTGELQSTPRRPKAKILKLCWNHWCRSHP